MDVSANSASVYLLIAVAAVLTYATRIGGYLIVARFSRLPARVAAGLDAVPAAVMTTLVAPAAFSGTWREALALALTLLLGLRAGPLTTVVGGTSSLIALRALTA